MKNYCHLCGAKYIEGKSQPYFCTGCGNKSFESSKVAVGLIVFNENGEALVTQRAIEPNKGKFDMAGGFVDLNESLEEALERELIEELGLSKDNYTKPIFVKSHFEYYFYSNENLPVVVVFFVAKVNNSLKITAKDEVSSVKFVSINEIDSVDFSVSKYPDLFKEAYKVLFS